MSASAEQRIFLEIMDQVLNHAQFAFRHVKNDADRDDYIQETLCLAWKWVRRLLERGKDPREFPSAIAGFATKHLKSGRRFVGGKLGLKDALSKIAQARHDFTVKPLPASTASDREKLYSNPHGQRRQDLWEEILQEHDRSPVPEQAAFRIDFPAYRLSYDQRRRDMMDAMMQGEGTSELAECFGVTAGRISQMRREFQSAWAVFTADLVAT